MRRDGPYRRGQVAALALLVGGLALALLARGVLRLK
jgi:hypothetical protein